MTGFAYGCRGKNYGGDYPAATVIYAYMISLPTIFARLSEDLIRRLRPLMGGYKIFYLKLEADHVQTGSEKEK